jgi:pteridine reductase
MAEVRGKVALVTGSGVRVGQAIALELARAGAHLLVHYHQSAAGAQATVEQARSLGVEARALQADLSDAVAVQRLLDEAQAAFPQVDMLVHAASPFVRGSLGEVTLESWRSLFATVVESFLLLTQALAPELRAHGEGCIIAILDRGVFEPWPGYLAHAAAKSALWALARSLAVELAPEVRVNAIVPGPVLPPVGMPEQQQRRLAAGTLLGRWGAPTDVAQAVLFLARSDYINGEALFVDGGERWAHRKTRLARQAAGPAGGASGG